MSEWIHRRVHLDPDCELEKKFRRVFLGSFVLCILIVMHLMLLRATIGALPAPVRLSFFPILLWGLLVTGYAFYALWLTAEGRRVQLAELAKRDAATGAFTDTYLRQQLIKERTRALSTGQPAAIAHIKMQGIDRVIHAHGYTVGKIVLRELVQLTIDHLPPDATVAHLAGYEFAALVPATLLEEAHSMMQEVLTDIRGHRLDLGKPGEISGLDASIGIVSYPCDADAPPDATQAAQAAADQSRDRAGVHAPGKATLTAPREQQSASVPPPLRARVAPRHPPAAPWAATR